MREPQIITTTAETPSMFSEPERFLLPGLPCLIMTWAYGVSTHHAPSYSWINLWCINVCLMEFGWAFF